MTSPTGNEDHKELDGGRTPPPLRRLSSRQRKKYLIIQTLLAPHPFFLECEIYLEADLNEKIRKRQARYEITEFDVPK